MQSAKFHKKLYFFKTSQTLNSNVMFFLRKKYLLITLRLYNLHFLVFEFTNSCYS